MLESQLSHRGVLRAAGQTAEYFAARPTIVRELDELREVLEDRVDLAPEVLPVPEWPLALHRHYSRREIAAGGGCVTAGDKVVSLQAGILQLKDARRELLFVTLDKSGKSFSCRRRAIVTTQVAPSCSTGRPRLPRASLAPPGVDTSRVRPPAGRSSCSCAPTLIRPSRSSARSRTSHIPGIARSRSRGGSQPRCLPSSTIDTPPCARDSGAGRCGAKSRPKSGTASLRTRNRR